MKDNNEVDTVKMDYYKQFLEHAKKYMMDFKVSKQDVPPPSDDIKDKK